MRIEVKLWEGDVSAWNGFVECSPHACIFHDARWKRVIERTFGHKCHYLTAFFGQSLVGILPLVEMRSLLFGHFMVSLPFVTYGGIATKDAEVEQALAAAAVELAGIRRARHLELRQWEPVSLAWPCRRHKVALVVRLPVRIEEYWGGLSSRLRGKVRKAEKSGAVLEVLGADGVAEFYSVFARNMRDLGTPVYPQRFFRNILELFPASAWVFLVKLAGRAVAAALGLTDRDTLRLPWICSDYRHSSNYMNEFLYWAVMEWASSQGLVAVDLGRSTAGGGGHRFKTQWKPEEKVLPWHYWTSDGAPLPEHNPENPRYALAIRYWRRLPLRVANLLGPRIVRNIP